MSRLKGFEPSVSRAAPLCPAGASLFRRALQVAARLSTGKRVRSAAAVFPASPSPPHAALYRATVARTGQVLCESAWAPMGPIARLRGLLGYRALERSAGLLVKPSSGVHTFGMAFPIDIAVLDKENCVLALRHRVGPGRICGAGWKTRSVLELAPGRLREAGVCRGDRILFTLRNRGQA